MPNYNGRELDSTDYRDAEVLEWLYCDEQLVTREIGDIFDVDHKTILRWMEKHDIDRRNNRTPGATYYLNNKGRCMWAVNKDGQTHHVSVQRLTAVAEFGFTTVAENHVHHKIPIPWLNYPDNLVVKGPSQHLREHSIGENSSNSALSREQVREIKHLLENTTLSQSEIASQFPVTRRTISNINTENTWAHIELRPP